MKITYLIMLIFLLNCSYRNSNNTNHFNRNIIGKWEIIKIDFIKTNEEPKIEITEDIKSKFLHSVFFFNRNGNFFPLTNKKNKGQYTISNDEISLIEKKEVTTFEFKFYTNDSLKLILNDDLKYEFTLIRVD